MGLVDKDDPDDRMKETTNTNPETEMKLINLDLTTITKNFAGNTIRNLNNERYTELVLETIELREAGYTWDQCDDVLGLESGTPNSAYALLKQQAAKAIARKVQSFKAVQKVVSEIC